MTFTLQKVCLLLEGRQTIHSQKPKVTFRGGKWKGRNIPVLEPTASFRIMDLPAEIRTMIYAELFEESKDIAIHSHKPYNQPCRPVRGSFVSGPHADRAGLTWNQTTAKWEGQPPSAYAILRTSKKIFEEAAPVAYGHNTFSFPLLSDVNLFLANIGEMRSHLRHIGLGRNGWQVSYVRTVSNKLKDAKGLRTLRLHRTSFRSAPMPRYPAYGIRIERLVEGLLPLLRTLRKEQEKKQTSQSILNFIRLDKEDCPRCREKISTRRFSSLRKVPCKKPAEHYEKLEASIRSVVKARLAIKE